MCVDHASEEPPPALAEDPVPTLGDEEALPLSGGSLLGRRGVEGEDETDDAEASEARRLSRRAALTADRARAGRLFLVDRILQQREGSKRGDVEYLVKWKGYGPEDYTWEPQTSFEGCAVCRFAILVCCTHTLLCKCECVR